MVKIRPIKKQNLEILYKEMFDSAVPWLHGKNLAEQIKGNSVWLIAWQDKLPVGHIQITFKNSEVKKIRKQIKRCPHLSTLYVNSKFRRKGIAKKIMKYAEKLVKKKGYKRVGLSVEKDNKFLNNLYEKLGYKDWKKGIVLDSWQELHNKKLKRISEKCNYLIKNLK